MEDKIIEEKGRALAEEIIAQLKREGHVFKKSSKDAPDYDAISAKNLEAYNKLLETGIAKLMLKM